MLRPASSSLVVAIVVVCILATAGCASFGVKVEGTSGPIAWRATDLNTVTKLIDGQERDDYAFTLVLRNIGSSPLTFTSVERTVYQAGGGQAGRSVSTGVWEMRPGGEWKLPLFSYQYCNASMGCTHRATSAPMWSIILRGRDASNRDVSVPLDIALPAVPAGKEFQATARLRPVGVDSVAAKENRSPVASKPEPLDARRNVVDPKKAPVASIKPPTPTPARDAPLSTVPVLIVENVVLVPATLNRSHGATLLLDTGAQHTIVTPALARRLNLVTRPDSLKRTITVVGGKKIEVPFVRLPAIEIGSASLVDVEVGVFDVAPESPIIDGLLGADVLSRYRMTIDHTARQLRLEPPK